MRWLLALVLLVFLSGTVAAQDFQNEEKEVFLDTGGPPPSSAPSTGGPGPSGGPTAWLVAGAIGSLTLGLAVLALLRRSWVDASLWGLLVGFTRIDRDRVLRNRVRAEVYQRIQADPGVSIADLADATGIHRSTARYHVQVLARHRLVTTALAGGHAHVYAREPESPRPTGDAQASALLAHAARAEIVRLLAKRSRNMSELARGVGVHRKTLRHHVRLLQDAGVVRVERDPRATTVHLVQPGADAGVKLAPFGRHRASVT